MTIDINAYHGNWPYWPMRATDTASMLAEMDRLGIETAFVSSLEGVFVHPGDGNARTLALAARHPDRFAPALTYSPYASGRDAYRDELRGPGPRLLKLFPSHHSYDPLEEPWIAELLENAGAWRVPVLVPHRLLMSWRLPTFDIRKIGALAAAHPETRFIIGSVNYLLELQAALDVLRRHANVFLETSAMMALREVEALVDQVGAERLLHGTCLPLQMAAIGPLKVHAAAISDAEKEMVLDGNARRLIPALGESPQGAG